MDARIIEVNLSQDKIDCITSVYNTQLRYRKEAVLKNVSEKLCKGIERSSTTESILDSQA